MKIVAYGCREEERTYFEKLQRKYSGQAELEIIQEHLCTDTAEKAKGADAVSIEGQCRADRETLHQLQEYGVRYLSTRTVGYNNIDLAAAKEYGIRCSNVTYSPYGVANFTVLLILASIRKFVHLMARSEVMDYSLRGMEGEELQNLTVGIVGMGRIGKAVAKCLSGFGCPIIAYTNHPNEETRALAEEVSLEELYGRADIITLHLPLTEQNYHMIDQQAISGMKDGVYIINTARGELIDTKALIDAVESGKVAGAAVDSFENEQQVIHIDHEATPIVNRDLMTLKAYPNVLVSPHAAFYTRQAVEDMVNCSVEGLLQWCRGGENPQEVSVSLR